MIAPQLTRDVIADRIRRKLAANGAAPEVIRLVLHNTTKDQVVQLARKLGVMSDDEV